MNSHQRRLGLLKILAQHKAATVDELVLWLNASQATVRRDISWLAARNQLIRFRGGATQLPAQTQQSRPIETGMSNILMATGAKRAIARHAAGLCEDGETIIINGGTTTYMMAEFLESARVTILTNSFLMAEQLLRNSDNEIILVGGTIHRDHNVILSPFDTDITRHHYVSKMFIGCHAISTIGLLAADPALVQADRRMIDQAEEIILLADSSKFSGKEGYMLCELQRIQQVITDADIPHPVVRMLEQAGIEVIIATADRLQQ